jgi:hypothetical protein
VSAAPQLSIELLEDAIALAHPDRHPVERADRANRVTAQLLALRPHVQESAADPGPVPGEQRIPLWVSFRTISASGPVVAVPAYLLKIKINSVTEGSSLELFDAKTETNPSTGVLRPHADTRYLAIHHRTAIFARIRGAMDVTFFFIKENS